MALLNNEGLNLLTGENIKTLDELEKKLIYLKNKYKCIILFEINKDEKCITSGFYHNIMVFNEDEELDMNNCYTLYITNFNQILLEITDNLIDYQPTDKLDVTNESIKSLIDDYSVCGEKFQINEFIRLGTINRFIQFSLPPDLIIEIIQNEVMQLYNIINPIFLEIINKYLLGANDNELYDIFTTYFISDEYYSNINNNNNKKFIIKSMFMKIIYDYYWYTNRYLCKRILVTTLKDVSNSAFQLEVLLSQHSLDLIKITDIFI